MPEVAGDNIGYRISIDGLSQLDGLRNVIKDIKKRMPEMSKSIKSAQTSVKGLNSEIARGNTTSIGRQQHEFDNLTSSIGRTGSKINWATIETTQLSRTMKKAGGTSYFKQQSRDLTELGNKMQSFGRKATAATAAIVTGAGIAIKTATNLQNRYKVITNLAVTGGEKQAEATKNVTAMQKEGTKYSNEYGVSQKNIGQGYETLIRRGYTTNQALGSQKSYLQGAIASGDSYADVVNNAASAIEQFGMKVSSVKGMALASKTAINQMAYSADLTATSFSDLGEALKYAGPDAHAAHQTMHTTVSAIGQLSNAGIEGSQAGTSMRQIYQRLTNPPSKGKAPNAIAKLGLKYSDFRDSKNELLPIQDIFGKLATKMNQMKMSHTEKGAIYAALFGSNASSAAQTLGETYKQVDKLDKKVRKSQNMNHGEGYAATLSKKNMNTFQYQWGRVKSGLINAGVNIANAWMPSLTKIAKGLANVLDRFQALPEPTKKFISIGVGITAVVGPLALVAGSLLKIRGAMSSITKLAGNGSSGKLGLADQVAGFLGVGQGKNSPKKFDERLGTTHFRSRARVPSSLIANGVDWKGIGRARRSFRATTRKVVTKVRPGRALVSGMDKVKAGRSKLWGMTKSGVSSGFGKIKGGFNFLKNSKLGSVAKFGGKIASRIPILDVAMAGSNLIGMNKKNAGKKVGSAGGMLAGGAIGSLLGPVGGMAGAAIGQALGTKLGATVQKSLPKKLQKSIGSAVKSVQKTFKGLLKPFQSTIKSISKVWSSATKGISKAWKQYVVKPLSGKNGGAAIKDTLKLFKVILVPTMKIAGTAFKVFGAVVKTAINIVAHVVEGLIKTISGVFSLVSDLIHHRWKQAWKDAFQIFTGIFGTIGNVLGDILKTVWDGIVDLGKNIGKFLTHPIKTIESWVGGKSVKYSKSDRQKQHQAQKASASAGNATAAGSDVGGLSMGHATGGLMTSAHMALVGEAGPEMAYHPGKGYMRWLGKNGPTLAHVKPGERILNAKDSANVATGGLGRGMTLPGYASGTAKLVRGKKNKRSVSLEFDAYGASSKTSLKSLNKLQKGSKKTWSTMQKDSTKSVKLLSKTNLGEFDGIQKDTNKRTDTIRKNTVSDFDAMQKGSMVQMNQLHKGMNSVTQAIVSDFDRVFGKLSGYAHKAMAAAIKQLNSGISGINSTFSQFGGNTQILKPISYAKGSNGRIPTDQLAILNDAQTGPRQEAVVHNNGQVSLVHGKNSVHYLKKGERVLNGHQTTEFINRGGIARYAKGSGVSNGTLEKLVENSQKNVSGSWQKAYADHVHSGGSRLSQEVTSSGQGAARKIGVPWITAAWSVLSDLIGGGGGTRKAFLKYAEEHFSGKPYVMGGTGPSVYDCSGMVSTALKHFGIDAGRTTTAMQGSSALKRLGTSYHLGEPGDLYLFGHGNGAAGHVGILKNPHTGSMFNETPPRARVTSIDDVTSVSHDGVYRVKGLHDQESKNAAKADPRLKKLFKRQLGKKAMDSLESKFSDGDLGSIGGQPVGDYESLIRKAARAMHASIPGGKWMSYMLGMIKNESGGRAHITGIDDHDGTGAAMGLLQYKRSTFGAYALKGHQNILSAWDQLLAFFNNSNYKTDIGIGYNGKVGEWRGRGSGPSGHRRFANGGWAKKGAVNIFGEARGQNEVAINTSRPSADPLLMEAISDRGKKSQGGVFAQFKDFLKMRKQAAEIKQSQVKFNEMRQSVTQSKAKTTIRPVFKFEPKIVVQNPTNADEAKRGVQVGAKASFADFKAFLDSYIEASMAE